ncbi:hypothetical protein VTN49DRAFT_989 [Thermomyces lanuginosus]|uniref:uncharacterized protein n=1 Tax=Thermomyces lanuginosus TaxID=5541 RepID=UPI003743EE60
MRKRLGSKKNANSSKNAAKKKDTTETAKTDHKTNRLKDHHDFGRSPKNAEEVIDDQEAMDQRSTATIRALMRSTIMERTLHPYCPKSWDRMYDKWSNAHKREWGFNVS